MKVKIYPSRAIGTVQSKPSKSSMQRAVAAALMADGISILSNVSYCDDSQSALKMAECLGAKVERSTEVIRIEGGLNPVCKELNCGESGLGVRLFSALSSLCKEEIGITGSGSIMRRPMSMIEDSLRKLGAEVESSDGFLPIKIKGPISGGSIMIDGSLSSQLITGLLFALPLARNDSLLRISSLNSKPYIDLSISVLNSFGIEIKNRNYEEIFIKGNQVYRPTEYRIEEDWSGISFLAVLGAVSGKILVKGLSHKSIQADRAIVDVLQMAGAKIVSKENELIVAPGDLKAFQFDIADCPDLAPPLTALASFCKGKSVLTGTSRLESKESNRSLTLKKEFSKLGIEIRVGKNSMEIFGGNDITAGEVCAHGDHRIAMALALIATRAEGPVIISGAEAVSKSYPGFFEDISNLGITVEHINN